MFMTNKLYKEADKATLVESTYQTLKLFTGLNNIKEIVELYENSDTIHD
jgi:hypothetical protein